MSTTSLYQEMRREWRLFRDDRVGHRFRDHQARLKNGSLRMRAVSMLFGLVLLAAGVVLCFIPGPGLPVMIFGIALLAGESSIREAMAFPKTASAEDLMAGAPSPVDDKQLRDLHLRPVRAADPKATINN